MKIDFQLCDKGTVIHVPKSDKQFAVYAKSLGGVYDADTDAYYVKPILSPPMLEIASETYQLNFAGSPDDDQMKVIEGMDDITVEFRTSGKRRPSPVKLECQVKRAGKDKYLIFTPEKNETVRSAIRQADGIHVRDMGCWVVPAETHKKAVDICKSFWRVPPIKKATKADTLAIDLAAKKELAGAKRKQENQNKIIIGSVFLKYRKTLHKDVLSEVMEMFEERIGNPNVREALKLPVLEKSSG